MLSFNLLIYVGISSIIKILDKFDEDSLCANCGHKESEHEMEDECDITYCNHEDCECLKFVRKEEK